MNYSVFRFTLNMHNHRSQASVAAFRGDTAIRLLITLTDGGNPYFIEDGCFAVINGTKADETIFRNYCTILNNTVIQYDFTEQTSSCEGVVNCDISLFGADGKLLTAPKFTLVVDEREANNDGLIESVTESSALDEVFKFKASHNSDTEAHQALFQAQQANLEAHNNATGMHYNAFREHNADENAHSALFAKIDMDITQNFVDIRGLESDVGVLERTSITDIRVSFSDETKCLTFSILRDGPNGADKDISVNLPLSALKIASVNDYTKDEKRYLEITFEDGTKLSDIEFDEIFRGIDDLLKDKVNTSDLEASLSAVNDAIAKKADKITDSKQIYATDAEGNPTGIEYSEESKGNTIPIRNKYGDIILNTTASPQSGVRAAVSVQQMKTYVNGTAAPKEETETALAEIQTKVNKIEGLLINYIVDGSEAYAKRVPTNSASKAIINSVGGKTVEGIVGNLCTDAVEGGIPLTVEANSGCSYSWSFPAGTYSMRMGWEEQVGNLTNSLINYYYYNEYGDYYEDWLYDSTFTIPYDFTIQVQFENFVWDGEAIDAEVILYPVIVEGTKVPDKYIPYSGACKYTPTKVTQIVSKFNCPDMYTSEVVETCELPEDVVNDADWGVSIDDAVNTYNFDTKTYSKYAKIKVYKGTDDEEWMVETLTGGLNFYDNNSLVSKPTVLKCNRFTTHKSGSTVRNNAYISSSGKLNVTADGYNDVSEWKAQLATWYDEGAPLAVVYKLIEAENNLITDDSYTDYKSISVKTKGEGEYAYYQSYGELIAENEDKKSVPWKVTFAEV